MWPNLDYFLVINVIYVTETLLNYKLVKYLHNLSFLKKR